MGKLLHFPGSNPGIETGGPRKEDREFKATQDKTKQEYTGLDVMNLINMTRLLSQELTFPDQQRYMSLYNREIQAYTDEQIAAYVSHDQKEWMTKPGFYYCVALEAANRWGKNIR